MGIYFGFEDLLKNLNPEKEAGEPPLWFGWICPRAPSFEEKGPAGVDYR